MRSLRRFVVNVLVALSLVSAPWAVRAQQPEPPGALEDIDDPKLARRLGNPRRGSRPPLRHRAAVGPGAMVAAARWRARGARRRSCRARGAGPPLRGGATPPRTPRLKLAYRRFTFAQVGRTSASGPGLDEPFDVLSVDFYPVSSEWRFGLTTQYGWETGTFRQGGDAFIAQSVSLGVQSPGPVFTPFVEGYAVAGLMQRTKKDLMPSTGTGLNSVATAYGQIGVDVGTEIFLARHFCLSAAIGFIHAGNGFVKDAVFGSFSVDALSFKLGIGL